MTRKAGSWAQPDQARVPTGDPARITIRRRVSWVDTDAAGIYHWTTAFRFAEDAEAALHTALGVVGATFGLTPRLAVAASFRAPLAFNDLVEISFAVTDVGRTSVRYRFTLTHRGAQAATGTVASCLIDPATRRAALWPDHIRQALAAGGPQTESDPV